MPEPDAAPPPTADRPEDLHIVLFGLPAAGKSSLLGALSQAAQAQEHLLNGRLLDPTHGLEELRHRLYDEQARRTAEEVVPYPIDFEPFPQNGRPGADGDKEHLRAVVIDCDGRVANDLLVRRQDLSEDSPEGTLAHEVVEADTLVLVIDASAPPSQVEADFAEFDRFLRQMERGRGRRTEVGGLPVFLVLSKCDLLAQPEDTAAAWMERIEERKRDLDRRFRDFLDRRAREAGPPPFGHIDLHLWATAVKRPALAGSPAKPREPYGVAELFRQCLAEAAAHRDRRRRSARRLFWTVGGAAGLVALLLSGTVGLVVYNQRNVTTPLQNKVEIFRFTDRPSSAAERLRGPVSDLRQRLELLAEIRNDPDFGKLPEAHQQLVRDRMEELRSYLAYWDRLQQGPRPADARTVQALQEAQELYQTELNLPHPDWEQTEAGKLRQERLADAQALRRAASHARNWYLDSAERADALWTFRGYQGAAGIKWPEWSADSERLLSPAHTPPFTDTEAIPGAATPLTYAAALRFDKVAEAQADWEGQKRRLGRLLDVTAALGLAGPVKGRPPVLVVARDFALNQARPRLQELRQAYPNYQAEFTLNGLPEAVVPAVQQSAGASYTNLLGPAQALVLRKLQEAGSGAAETPARWGPVRDWLKSPDELASWRVLATLAAGLTRADAPDPVSALAAFLQQPRFTVEIQRLTLEIPDSLKVKPAADASLSVYHLGGAEERKPALVFEQSGEGQRDAQRRVWTYSFRLLEGKRIVYQPGDRFWATLPLRDDRLLTWARYRSTVYQFECLRRPPRLHKASEPNTSGSLEEGVRLLITPDDGVPKVPDLMPVVRLER
jgi:hypothetical protein